MAAGIGRVLLISKGTYSGSTVYNMLDWVRYDNKAWVCKVDGTVGITPVEGANWTLMAADGSVSGNVNWSNVSNKPFATVDSNDFEVDANDELNIKRNTFGKMRIVSGGSTTDLEASGDSVFEIDAGSNVTITADDSSTPKKITINSSGGGGGSSTFAGLSDTDISSPQDNQIVQYATVSGNKVLQNVTMDASPTQNSAKPVTSGGVYTALSGKASTSDLDEWTSGVQTLDGSTFVFDNLDDTYGYDLFGDDKLYTITNFAKGTGTNTGTIKLTYTVSGASIGDYGYLRIFK